MRLTDLNPQWFAADKRRGIGISFDCPCAKCLAIPREEYNEYQYRLFVHVNPALDGKPSPVGQRAWQRTGDTFATMTLHPSIHRVEPIGCGWHGFVTNGEVTTV